MTREEAINNVKSFIGQLTEGHQESILALVPELRESEDERIRKVLVTMAKVPRKEVYEAQGITKEQALAYLERLKEQKPAEWSDDVVRCGIKEVGLTQHQIEWFKKNVFPPKQEWSEEDEDNIKTLIQVVRGQLGLSECRQEYIVNWLKSLRPQPKNEWSEEDENMLAWAKELVWSLEGNCDLLDWFKSLRPSWKPSEEQLEALRRAVNKLAKSDVADSVRLSIMYDNLKKLK